MHLTDENSSQDWNEAEDPSDPSTHASANPASIKNPLLPGGAVTSSLKKKAQGLSLKIPKHWTVILVWLVYVWSKEANKGGSRKGKWSILGFPHLEGTWSNIFVHRFYRIGIINIDRSHHHCLLCSFSFRSAFSFPKRFHKNNETFSLLPIASATIMESWRFAGDLLIRRKRWRHGIP